MSTGEVAGGHLSGDSDPRDSGETVEYASELRHPNMGRWAFILGPSRGVNFHTPQLYHFAKKAPGRDAKKCRCSRLDAVSHQILSLSLSQNGGGPRDMGIATGWIPGSRLWDKRLVCKKYYRKFSWDRSRGDE